mgnify:CR=1 FL=1
MDSTIQLSSNWTLKFIFALWQSAEKIADELVKPATNLHKALLRMELLNEDYISNRCKYIDEYNKIFYGMFLV